MFKLTICLCYPDGKSIVCFFRYCISPPSTAMEVRCGGLFFTSNFDSGNLARVEKVPKEDGDDDSGRASPTIYLYMKTSEVCPV